MPRESKDISFFNVGLITSQDNADIPDDATPISIDIENESDEGKLEGRLTDTLRSSQRGYYSRKGAIIQKTDGTRDIILHGKSITNSDLEALRALQNFQTATESEIQLVSLPTNSATTLVTHNQEVHVGIGSTVTSTPKWIGYTKNDAFHGAGKTTLIATDAELLFPKSFPTLAKIVLSATHIFGYEEFGSILYKINRSTGAIEQTEPGIFSEIRSICEDTDTNYIWVYDIGATTHGTLKKVAKADLSVGDSASLAAPASADLDRTYASDIIATTLYVWIARHNPNMPSWVWSEGNRVNTSTIQSDPNFTHHWLYRVAKSSIPGSLVAQNEITPKMSSVLLASHNFYVKKPDGTYVADRIYVQETFKISLVRLAADEIGWALRCANSLTVAATPQYISDVYYDNGVSKNPLYSFIFCVKDTSAYNTNAAIIRFDRTRNHRGTSGIYFDISGSNLYWTFPSKLIAKANVSAIPDILGVPPTDLDISASPTVAALNYEESVQTIDTDLYLTRLPGNESGAGIDKIDTTLATQTQVFGGAQVTIVNTGTGVDSFSENTRYYYKICFKYDGYQHGPLTEAELLTVSNGDGVFSSTIPKITVNDITKISPRVSHICVFRARSSSDDPHPTEYYRLVREVTLSDPSWVLVGDQASFTFSDNIEDIGQPYTQISGMPETLTTSMVNYELSTSLNSQLFVAKCFKKELTDASHYIFRSKPSRYDMFDWTADFLKLPIIPTAIAAYAGRIWVFDKNICYMVNPESLTVEEVFHGIGADNDRCVLVTDAGLFVCNKINIWLGDGRFFHPIGDAIRTKSTSLSESVSWKDVAHTQHDPFITLNNKRNCILFHVSQGTASLEYAFVYHFLKKRWDYWSFQLAEILGTTAYYTGGFTDVDGTLWYSNFDGLYSMNSSSTRVQFYFYTKRFVFDESGQPKKLYKVRVDFSGTTPTIIYDLDSAGTFAGTLTIPTMPTVDRKSRSIQFKITGGATTTIRAIELVFRHMIGKR